MLAIWSNVVIPERERDAPFSLKKAVRHACFKSPPWGDVRGHHRNFAISTLTVSAIVQRGRRLEVEQFVPVSRPCRVDASRDRDPVLFAGARKRLNINLPSTGLVRDICHPAPVGRELAIYQTEFGLAKSFRFPWSGHWPGPDLTVA